MTELTLNAILTDVPALRMFRIVAFNRLESRPRTLDFTRALRAEVRDSLWMLTRQWQFGEFNGEDAASPVTCRIAYQHRAMDRVAFRDKNAFAFEATPMPLETRVERERIPLTVRETSAGELFSDVLFAVRWGKQFLKMLKAGGMEKHYPLYLEKFPIRVLPVEGSTGGQRTVQDADAEHIRVAMRGRIADGVAIWRALTGATHDAWLDSRPGGDKAAVKAIAATFGQYCSKKIGRLFTQPNDAQDSAWLPNRLEYRFSVGSQAGANGGQTVLLAEQYHEGHLDWHSFDVMKDGKIALDPEPAPIDEPEQVESFLPAPVRFKGQPQPRFWEMEETQTDFGKIETSTTGLLHLILAEFGLIYSNDWFMLPHPMPINTVCTTRGILVDDTFGRHTFIRPAARGQETAWQRWSMFHLAEKGRDWPEDNRFYLVPAVGKLLESDPLERVNFVRDEMTNMAWAVERILPSQTAQGMSGSEPAGPDAELPMAADGGAKIRYVLGTRVPKNWIPFIPVHAEGSVSEIRLQRARMAGGEPPRGWLLREPGSPYFVEEEEVPRAGIYVQRSWQRARWINGRNFIWVGRRKTAGRGEGSSGLAFDRIQDLKSRA
jgi:hypothetical protein